eukprot:125393_1
MATGNTGNIQTGHYTRLDDDTITSPPKDNKKTYLIVAAIIVILVVLGVSIVAIADHIMKKDSHKHSSTPLPTVANATLLPSLSPTLPPSVSPTIGNLTSPPSSSCPCYGSASNCCCYTQDDTCDSGLLCNPDDEMCIKSSNRDPICGSNGDFIGCVLRGDAGVITGACGSTESGDCAYYNPQCASEVGFTGIECDYESLGTYNGDNTDWKCGAKGVQISCIGSGGSKDIMIGLCGSGSTPDCGLPCDSSSAAILCNSVGDVSVNTTTCKWYSQANSGYFTDCPDGHIATGYCGSGAYKDCNKNVFQLQCCKLNYH